MKKKTIALLLTLAMLLGLVPSALAANGALSAETVSNTTETKSIKVFSIGNSFSQDAYEYMYKVFAAEGYTDFVLGYLYKGSCTLEQHVENAATDAAVYTYYRNDSDFWQTDVDETLLRGLAEEPWDYISFQTTSQRNGKPTVWGEPLAGPIAEMISYITANRTNPDAKLGWQMAWSNSKDYESEAYEHFNSDQEYMYQCIAETTQKDVASNENIDFVVPAGTAIQNARTSYFGDTLNRDGHHLNDLGKLIVAYTWYSVVTGDTVDEIKFSDIKIDGKALTSADRKVIAESVRNAVENPYAVTPSAYATQPDLYTVTVNGTSAWWMEGDTVTVTAATKNSRGFEKWEVVSGSAALADPSSQTTTFTMPAQNVELAPVYETKDKQGEATGVEVGFGRADVTPTDPQPLAGYGNTTSRMSNTTLTQEDGLTVTATAISDGGQTNLIMTTDFIRVPTAWGAKAQQAISEATGVPADQISISATHTHSAVDIGDRESDAQPAKAVTSDDPYFQVWLKGLVDASVEAMADLSDVIEAKVVSTKVEGMNWIRHWRNSLGRMNGVNFSETGVSYKGHPRETDQELQVIRFVRSGDKKDVVLINWQGHPTKASTSGTNYGSAGRPYISADYPGFLRRYVEEQDGDCLVAFFLGSSGNVNTTTEMSSVKRQWQPPEEADVYGEKLGNYVIEAMKNMTTVELGEVQSLRQQHIAVNRGYASTREIEQDVITIGKSIAFVTAGYEMFDVNGMDVKEASPYQITFVMTCSGGHEYMPSWEVCQYPILGGPEAYEAREAQFNEVPGTAEDLANGLIGMLNKLYNG